MDLFSSAHHFRDIFHDGLVRLAKLPDASLGQLVLVLANAVVLHDQELVDTVRRRVEPQLATAAGEAKTGGQPNEDVQVLQFVLQAKDPFALIGHRVTPAGYRLQYNPFRDFRPKREAQAAATTIQRPFDPAKFNFSRIPGESYWRGQVGGQEVACFYNKYPVEPYHTSVVPAPSAGFAQFLTSDHHQLAWLFCRQLASHTPDVVLAYNSLGAYASVNHLHFQMIANGGALPLVASAASQSPYPVPVSAYQDASASWDHIDQLQQRNQPFNLIYTPQQVLIIERNFQGSYAEPAWTTGFAWYELSGGIITVDPVAFRELGDSDIEAAFRRTVS